MPDSCWQCFGEGHLGSACPDDMCHGGDEVPCMHDDARTIRCDVCGGTGTLSGTDFEDDFDDDDFEEIISDEIKDGSQEAVL